MFKKATVNSSKVASSLSNYPAYVDLKRMNGGTSLTQAEADSIRVYADESKTTELAIEPVGVDELHVKIPSLTTTTEIYIDIDGARSPYAVTDTYGRNAVWSVFDNVYHFEGNSNDSTGNVNGTDTSVSYATGNGVVGQGIDLNGSSSKIDLGDRDAFKTIIVWVKRDATSGEDDIYTDWGSVNTIVFGCNSGRKLILFANNFGEYIDSGATLLTNGVWYRVAYINKEDGSSTSKIYINGASVGSATATTLTSATTLKAYIGAGDRGAGNFWDGKMDNMYFSEDSLTDEWIATEYNNQSDEATFWGTWTDAGGGGGSSIASYAGVAIANIKSYAGVLKANIQSWNGVSNA